MSVLDGLLLFCGTSGSITRLVVEDLDAELEPELEGDVVDDVECA